MKSDSYSQLIVEAQAQPVCDFCKRPVVNWDYPCADFVMRHLKWQSVGNWAACDKCADYIESDKLDDLAFLISGIVALSNPEVAKLGSFDQELFHRGYYGNLRELYRRFKANRLGERVKV